MSILTPFHTIVISLFHDVIFDSVLVNAFIPKLNSIFHKEGFVDKSRYTRFERFFSSSGNSVNITDTFFDWTRDN